MALSTRMCRNSPSAQSRYTVSVDTFLLDLTTIPVIGLGAYLGIIIVKKISERYYRWFIIATTLIAAVFILI